jgi:hypothetical protein
VSEIVEVGIVRGRSGTIAIQNHHIPAEFDIELSHSLLRSLTVLLGRLLAAIVSLTLLKPFRPEELNSLMQL